MINRKWMAAAILSTAAISGVASADGRTSDTLLGAIVGGAIGHGVGGRDGAIVGGVLGAAIGHNARNNDGETRYYYNNQPQVYYSAPPVYYPPEQVYYQPAPTTVYVEPSYRRGEWRGRHGHRHEEYYRRSEW